MEPHSTQRASRRPSSCSETPAVSPNRAPVRKCYYEIVLTLNVSNMHSCPRTSSVVLCIGFMGISINSLVIWYWSATDMVVIYLSSGITTRESSEQEKRATLSVVREENRHLNNSVMILTYALMNGRSLVFFRLNLFKTNTKWSALNWFSPEFYFPIIKLLQDTITASDPCTIMECYSANGTF